MNDQHNLHTAFITMLANLSKSTNASISYEDKNFKISITYSGTQSTNKASTSSDYSRTLDANETISKYASNPIYSENLYLNTVKSDIVGTVYLAPAPNDKPFVSIGSIVKRGESLCIIECMKVMNPIESEYEGEITEIHVNNGDIVEYGQPLFTIKGNKN